MSTAGLYLEAHKTPPRRIILDLDATDVPLHGNQEGRFFHGYYGNYCYLPLYIFDGRHLLVASCGAPTSTPRPAPPRRSRASCRTQRPRLTVADFVRDPGWPANVHPAILPLCRPILPSRYGGGGDSSTSSVPRRRPLPRLQSIRCEPPSVCVAAQPPFGRSAIGNWTLMSS